MINVVSGSVASKKGGTAGTGHLLAGQVIQIGFLETDAALVIGQGDAARRRVPRDASVHGSGERQRWKTAPR